MLLWFAVDLGVLWYIVETLVCWRFQWTIPKRHYHNDCMCGIMWIFCFKNFL